MDHRDTTSCRGVLGSGWAGTLALEDRSGARVPRHLEGPHVRIDATTTLGLVTTARTVWKHKQSLRKDLASTTNGRSLARALELLNGVPSGPKSAALACCRLLLPPRRGWSFRARLRSAVGENAPWRRSATNTLKSSAVTLPSSSFSIELAGNTSNL